MASERLKCYNRAMEKITTDIYTFGELRKAGYTYVDKTDRILPFVNDSQGRQFFLARPRRFGKSLLVSTLKSLFQGKRELFGGLAIEPQWDWTKTYPVVHLDMGSAYAGTVAEFNSVLGDMLSDVAGELNVTPSPGSTIAKRFVNLCDAVAKSTPTGQFVLLVDEYDKPLLGHLCRPEVEEFRSALKSFYSVVKTTEHLQRFALVTGVSKFSKVSIFSDLNNLVDLTLAADAATLLGYTHDEVRLYFPERLEALAAANGMTAEKAFDEIVRLYDGYRFEENAERVFNPVSLGRCLAERKFNSCWYETATPTFLVNMLRAHPQDVSDLTVSEAQLGSYEPSDPAVEPLLFQTGYLTIRDAEAVAGSRVYRLRFPNEEVRTAFSESLMKAYSSLGETAFTRAKLDCYYALVAHDLPAFFKSLAVLFANVPYDLTDRQNEQTWQAILVVILNFLGLRAVPEERTNAGRIDMSIRAGEEIYVVELKLDGSAPSAISQILKKRYHEKFLSEGKRVTLVGINFSTEKRGVASWRSREIKWLSG